MNDETAAGSAEAPHGGGYSPGGDGFGSPLQARAKFLENWDWQSVTYINRGSCERGKAQHGINSETHGPSAQEWEKIRGRELTLAKAFHTLRSFHKKAPFLFFNGNTFSTIGRELSLALFFDLSHARKAQVSSAVGHYIAGVMDFESMTEILVAVTQKVSFKSGDRVKTFRGSLRGTVVRVLSNDRVVWKSDGSATELIAAADSLLKI
jgi:hypothetical protein